MNIYRCLYCLVLPLLVLCLAACAAPESADTSLLPDTYPLDLDHQPPGQDLVAWGDDLSMALTRSAETCRPVLALYRNAGTVTDQPLIAEAAEDLFIPLHLPLEDGGARIFDGQGLDLVPPVPVVESPGELASLMIQALEAGEGKAPLWLQLAAEENGARERQLVSLAMVCFWEGEAKLGNLDGVLATRSGMMGDDEVVEVVYDPEVLKLDGLIESARAMDCARAVYAHTTRDLVHARELVGDLARPAPGRAEVVADDQVKYALKRIPMARLPLTPLQATRINAAIRLESGPRRWLSPRQLSLLDAAKRLLEEDPDALNSFLPPDKLSLLGEYQSRLEDRLR